MNDPVNEDFERAQNLVFAFFYPIYLISQITARA